MKLKRIKLLSIVFVSMVSGVSFAQNSLSFDGVNDRVDCGNDPTVQITGTAITLEAWIYPTSWKPNVWQGCIINKENNSPNQGYMLRCGDNGRLNFNLGNVSWNELTTDEVLELDSWQHVAATYDGTKMRVYLNGVPIDSLSTSVNIANSPQNLIIGDYTSFDREFAGKIDEVRIWDVTRSQEEIETLMHVGICAPVSGLQAYYKFDQGIAGGDNTGETVLLDNSGNGNDGTLENFALSGAISNWVEGAEIEAGEIEITMDAVACETYTVPSGDETYTELGSYVVQDTVFNSFSGCEEFLTINLTLGEGVTFASSTVSVCESYTVPSGDETYTTGGTYIVMDTLINAAGCDSILTIDLTLLVPTFASVVVNTCDSYTLPSGSPTYSSPGTYTLTDILENEAGCDSIISIDLTILGESTAEIEVSECYSYTVPSGDETYTEIGTYTVMDTISTAFGCDSIMFIELTIEEVNTLVNSADPVLTAEVEGAAYQWVDCNDDYAPIDGATNQSFTATENGDYAVIITDGECVDTSDCFTIVTLSLDENNWSQGIRIYPNPSNGNFSVDLTGVDDISALKILTFDGRLVAEENTSLNGLVTLNLDEPAGVYVVEVISGSGNAFFRLVIE